MTRHLATVDRSIRNSVRVVGLIFLPAIAALCGLMLLDEERRLSPTSGRFIFGLGLPGWVVYGGCVAFFTAWTAGIVITWIVEARRDRARRADPESDAPAPSDTGDAP